MEQAEAERRKKDTSGLEAHLHEKECEQAARDKEVADGVEAAAIKEGAAAAGAGKIRIVPYGT